MKRITNQITNLSKRLKLLRQQHNMTQVQLGKKIHALPTSIANWENVNSTRMPTIPQAIAIANVYHISLNQLLIDDPQQKNIRIHEIQHSNIYDSNNHLIDKKQKQALNALLDLIDNQ